MTRADMDKVRDDFVRATCFGNAADFDMLELHMRMVISCKLPLTSDESAFGRVRRLD